MGPFAEKERYQVIVEQSGEQNDNRTFEIEANPNELQTAVDDAIAGLMHCDVTAYRLDDNGDRVGDPAYEERIEDPYEDERELQSHNRPY